MKRIERIVVNSTSDVIKLLKEQKLDTDGKPTIKLVCWPHDMIGPWKFTLTKITEIEE